ncbi:MAG: GxxExxY protein [Ignavibacteria bacterium]
MDNINPDYLYSELSDSIIKCFYKVYNVLGFGFLEKIYQKSLEIELTNNGIIFEPQYPIKVYYENSIVGEYYADIFVEDKIIIEIKAISTLVKENELQLINYLKSTNIEVGLLLNFGEKPEIKRRVLTNDKKTFVK